MSAEFQINKSSYRIDSMHFLTQTCNKEYIQSHKKTWRKGYLPDIFCMFDFIILNVENNKTIINQMQNFLTQNFRLDDTTRFFYLNADSAFLVEIERTKSMVMTTSFINLFFVCMTLYITSTVIAMYSSYVLQ